MMPDTVHVHLVEITDSKLAKHLRLCTRNLKSDRVKCCAECPFESIITHAKPELGPLFSRKRERIND